MRASAHSRLGPQPSAHGQHGLRVGDGGEHLAHVVARAGAGGDDVGELGGVARRRHGLGDAGAGSAAFEGR